MSIALFAIVLVIAIVLFIGEYLPLYVSSIVLLAVQVLLGLLSPYEALSGFGSKPIILIGSLFVVVTAVQRCEIFSLIQPLIIAGSRGSRHLAFFLSLVTIGIFSVFLSNTVTVSFFVPILISLAQRFNESPRIWLLPAAFATVLGGMCSLLGSSTNILVSSYLPKYGLTELMLFDSSIVALPIAAAGIVFLVLFSGILLRENRVESKVSCRKQKSLVRTESHDTSTIKPIEKWQKNILFVLIGGVILLSTCTHVPIELNALIAALFVLVFRLVKLAELPGIINWKILVFLGGLMGLGVSMENSGMAAFLSDALFNSIATASPDWALLAFLGAAIVGTQMLSNQATAVLLLPVAMNLAQQLGVSPMPYVMAVMLGSSCGFMTPFEPFYMIVYEPGRYCARDYLRVGLPLTFICLFLAFILLPWAFPFHP